MSTSTLFSAATVGRRSTATIGAERIGIRLSPNGAFHGIQPWPMTDDDHIWLAGQRSTLGLADVHIVKGCRPGGPRRHAR